METLNKITTEDVKLDEINYSLKSEKFWQTTDLSKRTKEMPGLDGNF